jgi:hypothetical protein
MNNRMIMINRFNKNLKKSLKKLLMMYLKILMIFRWQIDLSFIDKF